MTRNKFFRCLPLAVILLLLLFVVLALTVPAALAAPAETPLPAPSQAPNGTLPSMASPTLAPLASPTLAPLPSPGATPQPDESGTLAGQLKSLLGNDNAETVDILLLMTILTLLPSILIMLTGFTRIIIVLSFVRNAMGMQQMPPNQVLVGLALFLTFFVMSPVIDQIRETAYTPYVEEQITQDEAIDRAMEPLHAFMLRQTSEEDLEFFVNAANLGPLQTEQDLPSRVLIPAFITSEIKWGFTIGFALYIPFLVIDMVVSSALMSMGMMMLPPVMISLPFKVMLFVAVNGWQMTVGSLITSFK